ncbi:unnamed protein product, partial [Coregonus sp. 'balchen']
VVLKPSEPVTTTQHHCSCAAGTALCNHTVALLFQSAHYSQMGTPVLPPVHSCTEAEQQWHKPRTMIEESYNNFDPLSKPLICSMGMSAEKLLVDSHFGKVQVGSLLSYQQPPITTLESNFQGCTFVLSEEDQLHIESLQVSFATAHKIEEATREQSTVSDWQVLWKPRLTSSRFRGLTSA